MALISDRWCRSTIFGVLTHRCCIFHGAFYPSPASPVAAVMSNATRSPTRPRLPHAAARRNVAYRGGPDIFALTLTSAVVLGIHAAVRRTCVIMPRAAKTNSTKEAPHGRRLAPDCGFATGRSGWKRGGVWMRPGAAGLRTREFWLLAIAVRRRPLAA